MIRRLAHLLALGLALGLCEVGSARAVEPPGRAADAAVAQQVLVMLRLPAQHFSAEGYADGYGSGGVRAARRRVADRLAHAHGLILISGWPMPLVGVDCFIMKVPAGQSPADAAAALSREHEVEWSEPVQVYRTQGVATAPNDPLYRLQPAAAAWRLADLHQIVTGRNVRVAVVDSQIDLRHPDLAGQIGIRQDFVVDHPGGAEAHGTGVAGVIAAVADNRLGIVGVAPEARLMALRACWQAADGPATVCDTLSLAKALHFAIDNGAQVINLSLTGPPDLLLAKLLDIAEARGMVVEPASHPGVIAVTDDPARRLEAGSYLAPGRDVPTTAPGGGWSLVNGSSFAAAHVSGLMALAREKSPRAHRPPTLATLRSGGIDACATVLATPIACDDCACGRPANYAAMARP
jgi:subtilisin family serine protease